MTDFAKYTNGVRSSKLGEGKDISHARLQDLEGKMYGRVVKILMRAERERR